MKINGSNDEGVILATMNGEEIRCDTCNRELKSAVEWIRSGSGIICETCYRSLLMPNMKISFDD